MKKQERLQKHREIIEKVTANKGPDESEETCCRRLQCSYSTYRYAKAVLAAEERSKGFDRVDPVRGTRMIAEEKLKAGDVLTVGSKAGRVRKLRVDPAIERSEREFWQDGKPKLIRVYVIEGEAAEVARYCSEMFMEQEGSK